MTNMYDEPKIFQGGDMDPYPHSEAGVEVGLSRATGYRLPACTIIRVCVLVRITF